MSRGRLRYARPAASLQSGSESAEVRRGDVPTPSAHASPLTHECTYDTAAEAYSECGGKGGCRCQVVKVCSCGVSYTETQWRALEQLGVQHIGCERGIGDGGCCYALVNCWCGSTLTRETMCKERANPAA